MFTANGCLTAGSLLGVMPPGEEVASLRLPLIGTEQATSSEAVNHTSIVSDTANADKPGDVTPFTLGKGLPPVPAKLVAKIPKGDFVDMAELLRDNMEAERRRPRASSGDPLSGSSRRQVPDLLSWIQCFWMYAAVVTSKHPDKTKQLLAYQTMIVREARRCGGKGWLAYDSMFRQQAILSPNCDWSKLNNSLYSVTFLTQQNGRGRTCPHCLETDHAAADCALAPAHRPGRQQSGRENERSYSRSSQGDRASVFVTHGTMDAVQCLIVAIDMCVPNVTALITRRSIVRSIPIIPLTSQGRTHPLNQWETKTEVILLLCWD